MSVPGLAAFPVVDENKSPQNIDRRSENPVSPVLLESNNEERISIRNDTPMVSFGSLPQRTLPVEHSVEQNPMRPTLPGTVPIEEPGQEALARPLPVEAVLGPPRVTQSIQFIPPGSVIPAKEYPREMVRRAETAATPSVVSPAVPLVIPAVVESVHGVLQEKTVVPGYTPFERRTYTVLPSGSSSESSGLELLMPPRLQKGTESGAKTE
jgi:hypothetical protein